MAAAGLIHRGGQLLVFHQEHGCIYNHPRNSRVIGVRANAATEGQHEIRVCINTTCKKSGSLETLDVIRSLAPPNVTVESCSCLGKCPISIFVNEYNMLIWIMECRKMWQWSKFGDPSRRGCGEPLQYCGARCSSSSSRMWSFKSRKQSQGSGVEAAGQQSV